MIRIDREYFPFSIHWNTNTRKKKKRNYNEFSWILLLLTHNDEIFIRVYVLERHFLMRNNRLRVSWQFRRLPAVKIVSLFVFFSSRTIRWILFITWIQPQPAPEGIVVRANGSLVVHCQHIVDHAIVLKKRKKRRKISKKRGKGGEVREKERKEKMSLGE